MNDCWLDLNGKCLYTAPEGYFGFVYLITHIPSGKIYVGKKQFAYSTKKKIGKRFIKQTKTRKRVERVQTDSKWLEYWGSSKELLADISLYGKENFKRQVLCYCLSKAELTYYELKYQIDYDVLYVNSYNGWIKGTVFKTTLNN